MDTRTQLLANLGGCLSPEPAVQKAAEEAVRRCSSIPGYGAALLEVLSGEAGELGVRHLAAVLLKQHLKVRWDPQPGEALPPIGETKGLSPKSEALERPMGEDEKDYIRHAIISTMLQCADPKVGTLLAVAIATIADMEWPHQWTNLVDSLVAGVPRAGQATAAVSGLKCLALIAEGMDDECVPLFVQKTFPTLNEILATSQGPSAAPVRSSALQVLHTCIAALAMMRGPHQREAAELIGSMVPSWMPQFIAILSTPIAASDLRECTVKTDTLKCLKQLTQNLGPLMAKYITDLLPCLWQTWVALEPVFELVVVGGAPTAEGDAQGSLTKQGGHAEKEEGGGRGRELEALVVQILEFILSLTENMRFQEHMRSAVESMVYHAIAFMQITREQEADWLSDVNHYVSDEDEQILSCRSSGCVLIEELVAVFEDEALRHVSTAVQRRLLCAAEAREQGSPTWWKAREAAILAAGAVADKFIGAEMGGTRLFDAEALLDMLLQHDMAPGGPQDLPFMHSRALWACGRFCPLASTPERHAAILDCATKGMEPQRSPVVHIGACRALARAIPNAPKEVLQQNIQRIYSAISDVLPHVADDELHLVLELLETVIRAGKHATSAVEAGLTPAVLTIWSENVNDPVISCDATDVLEAIADSPDCFGLLAYKAVPFLRSILEAPQPAQDPNELCAEGKVAGAIDILTMLLRRSSDDTLKLMFDLLFVPLGNLVLTSADQAELQNGAEAMSMFVRSGGDLLLSWSSQPEATMKLLLDIAGKLLSPDLDASASLFVGTYLEQLLSRFPSHIAPFIQQLVTAVVGRMAAQPLPTLTVSLILVIARLVHTCNEDERKHLIGLLAEQPMEGHGSGLMYLLKEWSQAQQDVQGRRKLQLSASALGLLVETRDPRLGTISVPGYQFQSIQGARSPGGRVRATPEMWAWVPLPVKAISLVAEALVVAEEDEPQLKLVADSQRHAAGVNALMMRQSSSSGGEGDEDEDDDFLDEDEGSDEEDEGDEDPLARVDFVEVLRNILSELDHVQLQQMQKYRSLFTEKQQRVIEHVLSASKRR